MERLIINMHNVTDKHMALEHSCRLAKEFEEIRGECKRVTIRWDEDELGWGAVAYSDRNWKDGIAWRFLRRE